jgi:trans-aconitate methyltransferase
MPALVYPRFMDKISSKSYRQKFIQRLSTTFWNLVAQNSMVKKLRTFVPDFFSVARLPEIKASTGGDMIWADVAFCFMPGVRHLLRQMSVALAPRSHS